MTPQQIQTVARFAIRAFDAIEGRDEARRRDGLARAVRIFTTVVTKPPNGHDPDQLAGCGVANFRAQTTGTNEREFIQS